MFTYRERAIYVGVEKQLKIVSYEILRGVWAGRHYPIVWYERDWSKIGQSFLFDEHLTSEIAAYVKRGLPEDSSLETIEKVFADLGHTEEIDSLADSLSHSYAEPHKEKIEIEIPKDRYAEIHCVAVCFSSGGRILAGIRPSTKRRFPNCLEFGCGQLRLDETFTSCLRRAYKDDFGVELILPEPLLPIGTYEIHDEEEHRIIPGIVFIAEIADEAEVAKKFSRQKHSEIIWLDPTAFQAGQYECVPGFERRIAAAIEARNRIWRTKN